MNTPEIRDVTGEPLEVNLDIIRRSFRTVADEMGITPENAPRYTAFLPLERLREERDNGARFFGYFLDGRQIGFVTAEPEEGGVWFMKRLAVLPEYRGRGIAGKLIEEVIDYVEGAGVNCLHIGIVNEQKGLKAWYEAMGFREYEVFEIPNLPFTVALLKMELNKKNGAI